MSPAERRLWRLLLAYGTFAGGMHRLAHSPGGLVDQQAIREALDWLDAARERVLGEPEPIEQEIERLSAEDQARGGLR